MRHITHPSKEQVRAYMHQREAEHRPPPTPDEIRRQLGWFSSGHGCHPGSGIYALSFPLRIGQFAVLLAVEWLFLASGFDRSR
jgi:hypothetical protein